MKGLLIFSRILKYSSLVSMVVSQSAYAGAISGEVDSVDNAASPSCDVRPAELVPTNFVEWCGPRKPILQNSCFIVVFQRTRKGDECDWQGCRHLMLVGQNPSVSGSNWVEYGLQTPKTALNTRSAIQMNGSRVELPRYKNDPLTVNNIVEQYITVKEALDIRNLCTKSPSGNVAGSSVESDAKAQAYGLSNSDKICNSTHAGAPFIDMNPYWRCLSLP